MEDQPAVVVKDLFKTFKLPHEKHSGVKQAVVNLFRGKRGYEIQKVLNDISFEIEKGDFFAIVGRNGSGKSTLLKLLAGIYAPDKGLIQVNGSLTPFIELGVGFNPELTGRENVFMNGALLGFDHKQMEEMYESIVEFAEITDFMDQKLKNYSSGMQVRLAFSIAIRAQSDILLLDEVLAVGDAAFQQKCYDYFEELKQAKQTVILVTHDMSAVKRFCNKALLIEDGLLKAFGTPEEIANQYILNNFSHTRKSGVKHEELGTDIASLEVKLKSNAQLNNKEDLEFEVEYIMNNEIELDLGISIMYGDVALVEQNTKGLHLKTAVNETHSLSYQLPLRYFNPGNYRINIAAFKRDNFELLGFNPHATHFIVRNSNNADVGGALAIDGVWKVNS